MVFKTDAASEECRAGETVLLVHADTIRDTHEEVFYFFNEIGHQGV